MPNKTVPTLRETAPAQHRLPAENKTQAPADGPRGPLHTSPTRPIDQNHQPDLPLADRRNKSRNTLSMPDMYRVARAFEKIRSEIKAHQYTNEKLIKYVADTLQLTVSRANVNTALEMIGLSLGTHRGGKDGPRLNGDGYNRIKVLERQVADLAAQVASLRGALGLTTG